MVTATITIGRNVNGPMDRERWDRFQLLLLRSIDDLAVPGILYFDGVGEGTWDGQVEQAYTVVVGLPEECLPILRLRLKDLARHFDQDAIALTVGETQLLSY
jgi:hypothetical protein